MKLTLIAIALFGLLSSLANPTRFALPAALILLIIFAVQRAANHHLSDKPGVLHRIRRRFLLGMTVGLMTELICSGATLIVLTLLNWKYVLQQEIVEDVERIESIFEAFLQQHPPTKLGRGTIFLSVPKIPRFCASIIKPWVFTWGFSSLTMAHSHVEQITRQTIVKDIVAFAAAAPCGIEFMGVFVFWYQNWMLEEFIIKSPSYSEVRETVRALLLILQAFAVKIICQMAFCIAAAEHHVLGRTRRTWAAFGKCLIVLVPYYFSDTVLQGVPVLQYIRSILCKIVGNLLILALLSQTRRKYCRLLAAAREKD